MESGNMTFNPAEFQDPNTLQSMLKRNIGKYVICELLIGLRSLSIREGVLIEVGNSYIILQNPNSGDSTSCDLYSLKFMTVPNREGQTTQYCPYASQQQSGCTQTTAASSCWLRLD